MEEPRKKVHLKDLFHKGRDVTIEVVSDGETYEIPLWMQLPSYNQQQEAMQKARAKKARTALNYKKGEDQYVALEAEVKEMDKDEVIEKLLEFDSDERSRQARNEVMYGDAGSDWGVEGQRYMDLQSAQIERYQEIEAHNDQFELPDDADRLIVYDKDEEMVKIQEELDVFAEEVNERKDLLDEDERRDMKMISVAKLRSRLMDELIDTETQLAWYQDYRMRQIFFAVRDPDDKRKPYFDSPDDILDLPPYVRQRLVNEYETMEMSVDELKNSLSLLRSSVY